MNAVKPKAIEALVAFIDLLGFSDRVLAVRSIDDLERVVGSIRTIRDYFKERRLHLAIFFGEGWIRVYGIMTLQVFLLVRLWSKPIG
jgi:hypothetical protein